MNDTSDQDRERQQGTASDHLDLAELAPIVEVVDGWVTGLATDLDAVDAVERLGGATQRWFVRMIGDTRGPFTVWIELRQRRVHFETYVAPYPVSQHQRFFEYFLRKNARSAPIRFGIGVEDGIVAFGELDTDQVNPARLEELLGASYLAAEAAAGFVRSGGFMAPPPDSD